MAGNRFLARRLSLLLFAALAGPGVPAAFLVYRDGRAIEGEVSRRADGNYVVPGPGKTRLLVPPAEVAWFTAAASAAAVVKEWHAALEQERAAEPGPGWLSLAKFCQLQGRSGEAAAFAARWGEPRGLAASSSPRFIFLTRGKAAVVAAARDHLEAVVDRLQADYPPPPGARAGCLVFFLPDETAASRLARSGPVGGASAWYLSLRRELVLLDWSSRSVRATLSAVTRVAAQYYLMDVYFAGCSPRRIWVVDGLANHLQGMAVKAGKAAEPPGKDRDLWERMRINLKAGVHIPLPRFLALRFEDLPGVDPYGGYQAQAWSLVWYLLEPGREEMGDLLGRFLRRLRETGDEERAWGETFGRCDLERLEQGWRRAVLAG